MTSIMFNKMFELVGADGNTYKFSPVTLADLSEYIEWYKWKEFEEAKVNTKGLDETTRKEFLHEIFKRCIEKVYDFNDSAILTSLASMTGALKLIYYSLRKNHPDISEKDVSNIIDISNIDVLSERINIVSGLSDPKAGE